MDARDTLFRTLDDAVSRFLYYDRKEDDDLPVGAIERMVLGGAVTVDEMVDYFRAKLESSASRSRAEAGR